jgi:hypothetical protein
MRIHRPAITGSISATNLIVSGTITAEGVQVPHGTAVSSSFAQKSAVSSSFAQKSAVSSSFAQKSAVSSSFAQKSAVSSSFVQGAAVSGSFVTSSAFTGNMGDISGSSISTGSFGHVMKGGVNWDSAVSTSAASEGFTASPAITAIASTAANQLLTDDGDGTATSEANLTFDGTHLTLGGTSGSIILPAGGGINFAAQTGDAGGMTKELLDDYEEGTWTGVVSDGTNAMTMNASYTTGYYTKIGNLVTVTGQFITTSLGSASGAIQITGLPFPVANNGAARVGGAVGYGGGFDITAGHTVNYWAVNNTSYILLYVWDVTTGVSEMQASEWTLDGNTMVGFSYRAA